MTHGVLDHFEWHTIDSPQYANLPFSATLAAVDAHGYTVADYNDTVELSGRMGDGVASTIVISEMERAGISWNSRTSPAGTSIFRVGEW